MFTKITELGAVIFIKYWNTYLRNVNRYFVVIILQSPTSLKNYVTLV